MLLRLCRFKVGESAPRVGLLEDEGTVLDLSNLGITSVTSVLEMEEAGPWLRAMLSSTKPERRLPGQFRLVCPIERQEIWAAGVTYQRSRVARTEESLTGASYYDRVYVADRPELFLKAAPEKAVGPKESVGIRSDSRWTVPEPELVVVCHSRGRIVGYTIGNDVTARDIEGENPLYLP
ncbi:MAG: fumarylacetoacetate hydrolase, partial [Verrucomicrobiae bacterium]|nr:fumarylacetoacetate hydrolase [Verrucomicrobiae bacterium]